MRTSRSLAVVAALVALGCGGQEPVARAQPPPSAAGSETACPPMRMHAGRMGRMGAECPLCAHLPGGASVRSEPIDGGVALTYTTSSPEDVAALRAQVQHMAAMHERRRGPGATSRRGARMGRMRMPPSSARAVDVEGGARLELRALDGDDVGALRAHVEQMRQCPVMASAAEAETPPG